MGHGSMGHGSLVQWVTWVMGHKKWPIVSSEPNPNRGEQFASNWSNECDTGETFAGLLQFKNETSARSGNRT